MTALYAIYGTGGHGRETMPLLRKQIGNARAVFIDDTPAAARINGHLVLDWPAFLALPATSRHVSIAIGSGKIRETLAAKITAAGVGFVTITAPNAIQLDDVIIGEGAILSPFASVTSNIRIGKHFHANTFCSVAHDCMIGDFVTFAPGVRCNGNTHIHDHAYIGTGAILRQGTPDAPLIIGKGAVVGMGAVVTRSVPAGVTVVGNPARPLIKPAP